MGTEILDLFAGLTDDQARELREQLLNAAEKLRDEITKPKTANDDLHSAFLDMRDKRQGKILRTINERAKHDDKTN